MDQAKLHRGSLIALIVLALLACGMVLPPAIAATLTGHFPTPNQDEGTAAHIFQLSVVAFGLMLLIFLATADWGRPLRALRTLSFPLVVLAVAFIVLYRFEHHG